MLAERVGTALTIAAGEKTGIITVDVLGDALKEGNEIFNLVLSNPAGAGFASGTTLTGIGTILDDEQVLSVAAGKIIEGKSGDTGKMSFTVSLPAAAGQDVTVDYATADSTAKNAAAAGTDYTATTGHLTIAAGEKTGIITVDVLGDALKEGNEIFNLVLSNPAGAGFASGITIQILGTIIDDEPVVSFG